MSSLRMEAAQRAFLIIWKCNQSDGAALMLAQAMTCSKENARRRLPASQSDRNVAKALVKKGALCLVFELEQESLPPGSSPWSCSVCTGAVSVLCTLSTSCSIGSADPHIAVNGG